MGAPQRALNRPRRRPRPRPRKAGVGRVVVIGPRSGSSPTVAIYRSEINRGRKTLFEDEDEDDDEDDYDQQRRFLDSRF
jgi:hypothetical protein